MTLGPRPRTSLPIAPGAEPSNPNRRLPLADATRAVDERWRPIYTVWEITLRCDLACRHCGSRAGRARPDELTTEEALNLVDQMADLGVKEVTVIGGEAYLRDDWLDIVKRIRSHGMTCGMTTGGRNLTLERLTAAKEAGLNGISVSVDGLRETHDMLRGVQGSFDAALNAIRHAKAIGMPVSANTQIGRQSIYQIEETFGLLAREGIHSWQVQLTVAMGRAADEPDVLLEPYQVLEVFAMLARIKKVADEHKVRIWPGNNIGYFGPYESMLKGTMPRGHMASCGAGRSTMGIEANGDIKGCPSLPTSDYVGGNIREHSLREIWERAPALRFTRDRTTAEMWGYCGTCYYKDTCRSGCSWTGHVLLGKRGNNPYCHHRALEMLREGKRERIVRVSAAEGRPFDYGRYELLVEDWPEHELKQARELVEAETGWLPQPGPGLDRIHGKELPPEII